MDASLFFAVAAFAFITSVTPGPNNIMLLASGAQYGFYRTLPHMFGIVIGVAMLLLSVLLGLGVLLTMYPFLFEILKVAGSTYLLWLALKIATAPIDEFGQKSSKEKGPMRWWESALFQFINPKAWMMALASVSTFSLPGDLYILSGTTIMIAFALLGFPAISLWAGAGMKIRIWLNTPARRRRFNLVMGALTAATLVFVLDS